MHSITLFQLSLSTIITCFAFSHSFVKPADVTKQDDVALAFHISSLYGKVVLLLVLLQPREITVNKKIKKHT